MPARFSSSSGCCGVLARQSAQEPPIAAKKVRTTEIHGYTLKDDYFWLREKANPEVLKYLEAENAYTEATMKGTKAFQESIYSEMLGRIKHD
jgi:oligopeptidase B